MNSLLEEHRKMKVCDKKAKRKAGFDYLKTSTSLFVSRSISVYKHNITFTTEQQ